MFGGIRRRECTTGKRAYMPIKREIERKSSSLMNDTKLDKVSRYFQAFSRNHYVQKGCQRCNQIVRVVPTINFEDVEEQRVGIDDGDAKPASDSCDRVIGLPMSRRLVRGTVHGWPGLWHICATRPPYHSLCQSPVVFIFALLTSIGLTLLL